MNDPLTIQMNRELAAHCADIRAGEKLDLPTVEKEMLLRFRDCPGLGDALECLWSVAEEYDGET